MGSLPQVRDSSIRRASVGPPRLNGPLVLRPRLLAQLNQGLRRPLTLVSAPAGFGKTTLLAQWEHTHALSTAWLRVDEADRDLSRFLVHCLAALGAASADAFAAAERLSIGSDQAPAAVGEALADALSGLTDDLMLIVDDYHHAASTPVEQFLIGFLREPPPAVHLVLATRTDPIVPLARLRLQGDLSEVRAADLRFTEPETSELLAALGHSGLDSSWNAALHGRTEGWVAGLRMAVLALGDDDQTRRRPVPEAIPDQHLMEYLLEEVLAQQPFEIQTVLLRLSVVDRLCASLAQVLLDAEFAEARNTLEHLGQRGLFLEGDADGEWFHFHPVFLRLLRHQLERRLSPSVVAELQLRASSWFAGHDLIDDAIRYCAAAGDHAGTAQLIAAHVDAALAREDWIRVSGWLQLLPERVLHRSPELLLAQAWAAHFSGRLTPTRGTRAAVELLLAGATGQAHIALRRECDVLELASSQPIEQDPEAALARARQALEHLPSERRLPLGLAIFSAGCALQATGRTEEAIRWLTDVANREEEHVDAVPLRALIALFFIYRQAGNLDAAAAIARQTLVLAEREDLAVSRGWAHWALGWVAYERDALDEARAHFTAITRDHRRVHLTCACEALMGLTLIAQATGDVDGADHSLQQTEEWVLADNALEFLPWLKAFEAHLSLVRGKPERAIAWQRSGRAAINDGSLQLRVHPFLVQIQSLVADGARESLDQARSDLAAMRAFAAARQATATLVAIGALEALTLEAQGDGTAALAALALAQDLGQPGGFRRTFLDLEPGLSPLLQAQRSDGQSSLAKQTAGDDGPGPSVRDVLTVREAEVLVELAQHLTYREIAERLYVSLETVKSHASSVYAKLAVDGRRAAVTRARQLGWIPQEPPAPLR